MSATVLARLPSARSTSAKRAVRLELSGSEGSALSPKGSPSTSRASAARKADARACQRKTRGSVEPPRYMRQPPWIRAASASPLPLKDAGARRAPIRGSSRASVRRVHGSGARTDTYDEEPGFPCPWQPPLLRGPVRGRAIRADMSIRHASALSGRVPTTATAGEGERKPAAAVERLLIVLSVAGRTLPPAGTSIRACAPSRPTSPTQGSGGKVGRRPHARLHLRPPVQPAKALVSA